MANGLFGGGDGTKLNPFLIEDAADLNAVSNMIINDPYRNFKVTKDIDMTGIVYNMIGDIAQGSPFMGTFDGGGKIINNLKINSSSPYSGLIGLCDNGAVLKRVQLYNAEVNGVIGIIGLLCGHIGVACIVDKCGVSGVIHGNENTLCGGLAGSVNVGSAISESFSDAIIESRYASGLVFECDGDISDCYALGEIRGVGGLTAGGLFITLYTNAQISNCFTNVKMNNYDTVGSVTGILTDQNRNVDISSCYADNDCITDERWVANELYSGEMRKYVKGTDDNVYELINVQDDKDYNIYPNPPPFYAAQPISGSRYSEFWREVTQTTHPYTRSTAQMKKQSTFVGWDFDNVWSINEGTFYPYLKWQSGKVISCISIPISKLEIKKMTIQQ